MITPGYKKDLLVGHILMKFPLQTYRQIQTSQVTAEAGCSTETALLSGGGHFEDNKMPNHSSAFYITRKPHETPITINHCFKIIIGYIPFSDEIHTYGF